MKLTHKITLKSNTYTKTMQLKYDCIKLNHCMVKASAHELGRPYLSQFSVGCCSN